MLNGASNLAGPRARPLQSIYFHYHAGFEFFRLIVKLYFALLDQIIISLHMYQTMEKESTERLDAKIVDKHKAWQTTA